MIEKVLMTRTQVQHAGNGSSEVVGIAREANSSPATRLHPKEHGAYAILAIPMVTALVMTGPTVIGVLVSIASVAGFLAHEPMLIAWGHRGRRAQTATPAASMRLRAYLALACLAGATAMVIGTAEIQLALAMCLVMAVVGFALAVMGKHRTRYGQLWGVASLSVPCVPILLAGHVSVSDAGMIWSTWLLGFSATTFVVHSVIAAQKGKPRGIYAAILLAVSLAVAVGVSLHLNEFAAIVPMLAVSWFLYFKPPPAKYLKRVGWSLVVATIATSLILIRLASIV